MKATLVSRETEEKLVGLLLLDNDALDDVADILVPDDFSTKDLRDAFNAIVKLRAQRAEADPGTVARAMGGANDLAVWLVDLQDRAISAASARAQATQLANLGRQRRLFRLLLDEQERIQEATLLTTGDAQTFFADVQKRIVEATTVARTNLVDARSLSIRVMKLAEARTQTRGQLVGFSTGFDGLDRLLLGVRRKALVIVAAKTGVGKTALALNLAKATAASGATTFVVSLEMGVDELGVRVMASASNVAGFRMENGDLYETDFVRLARGVQELAPLPLLFTDEPPTTISALRATCQAIKRRQGLDVVVVDYLQLVSGSSHGGTREREVAEVSRGLKLMAMELDIGVIALSQLNRVKAHNEEPGLGDLRDSGAIEQDANTVVFLWGDPEREERIFCKVAKNRGGPIGQLVLGFNKPIQRFTEMPS